MIPNYYRKIVSGWTNYSCMVISHKISEKIMGYRGSKSLPWNGRVKEQRVDGNHLKKKKNKFLLRLRYTLMGGESCYQVKIPSNQLKILSFSTLNFKPKLNPWFITLWPLQIRAEAGLVDAEDSIFTSIFKNNTYKLGWYLKTNFAIGFGKKRIIFIVTNTRIFWSNWIYHYK